MTSRNDITGDKIQTRPTTREYADNWDKIFGKCACSPDLCKCIDKCKLKEKENDREIQESK